MQRCIWNTVRRKRRARALGLALAAALTSVSCEDKPTNLVTGPGTPTVAARRVIGVAELTFRDINTVNITATATLAKSIADLETLRSTPGAQGNLDVIQVEAIVTGMFINAPRDSAPQRFLRATFGLRNSRADNIIFDALRENLSFVLVGTVLTLPNSPIRSVEGTVASKALAAQLTPTGLVGINGDGTVFTVDPDVVQSLTDAQVSATAVPAGASTIFPVAFPVRRLVSTTFDGVVTIGFRLPVATLPEDNPTSISIEFLIVDNTGATPH